MKIWLANKPKCGSGKKFPFIEDFITIDCSYDSRGHIGIYEAADLTPERLGPVYSSDGLKSLNLFNYMEYSKIFYKYGHDDNGPTDIWREWRKVGFTKKKRFEHHNTFQYYYDDKKYSRREMRDVFKSKLRELYKTSPAFAELKKIFSESNLLLIDYDIPDICNGFLFKKDLLIEKIEYKYSHLNVLAELLLSSSL